MRFGWLVLLAVGCDSTDDETDWIRFNADKDAIAVEVTADKALGPDVSEALYSTTGSNEIGMVTVSPGSGPVGTDHLVTIVVADDFQEVVGKVSVRPDGDRGSLTYDARQDSADHGYWVLTLTSQGSEGESRTDLFYLELYEEPVDSVDTDTEGT